MAVCKCKMCGGDLTITELDKIVVCEYCGTTQTVPSADNEKKMTLFNRANRLRMNSEFDKAAGIYENIIAEFPEEAEAYWGALLCKYGIEYVDDPATGEKKPTCHRASFEKAARDEYFELAMEYADVTAQKVYRDEAREIDRINEEILSISRNEQPYDIFICYKETDESGNRTPDSVMAQDIYDALTGKGYKVFFSRITLEDKLGLQYEPYIFAALNSAKIMLCVGTKYEYFHAVWVKNEWSRFLRLAAKDKSKVLIPCYRDMDPYDMPDEFRMLQAQDLGKLGAMQDLTRGVAKILGDAPAPVPATPVAAPVENPLAGATAPLLKRAFMYLEDGEWAKADEYAEKALDLDPENGDAYFAKTLARAQAPNGEALRFCRYDLRSEYAYQKAWRFASPAVREMLGAYVEEYRTVVEGNRIAERYEAAKAQMTDARRAADYEAAALEFSALSGYADSDALAAQCGEQANALRSGGTLRVIIETRAECGGMTVKVDNQTYETGPFHSFRIVEIELPAGRHSVNVRLPNGSPVGTVFVPIGAGRVKSVNVRETLLSGFKVSV